MRFQIFGLNLVNVMDLILKNARINGRTETVDIGINQGMIVAIFVKLIFILISHVSCLAATALQEQLKRL